MSGEFPVASTAVAAPNVLITGAEQINAPFEVSQTILSQYTSSPVLMALIDDFSQWLNGTERLNDFYRLIWNVDTAKGYGLDIWGRIVNVSRILTIPAANIYFGFQGQPTATNFYQAQFYRGASSSDNYVMIDDVYRKVILAKALANICDGSIKNINEILMVTFQGYGNCYVVDGGNMTMQYKFTIDLSQIDFAIASQTGILPKPTGVSYTIVQP